MINSRCPSFSEQAPYSGRKRASLVTMFFFLQDTKPVSRPMETTGLSFSGEGRTCQRSELSVVLFILLALFAQGCKGEKSKRADEKMESRSDVKETNVEPLKLGLFKKGTQDLQWMPINDNVVRGRSSVAVKVTSPGSEGRKHALEVKGSVKKGDFPFPFAGTQLSLSDVFDSGAKSFDISKWSGISFWAKGDGRKYYVRFHSEEIHDYNFHHFAFETSNKWKKFEIPFDSLVQFSWGNKVKWTGKRVAAVSFANYDQPGRGFGPILLQVDNLLFY